MRSSGIDRPGRAGSGQRAAGSDLVLPAASRLLPAQFGKLRDPGERWVWITGRTSPDTFYRCAGRRPVRGARVSL